MHRLRLNSACLASARRVFFPQLDARRIEEGAKTVSRQLANAAKRLGRRCPFVHRFEDRNVSEQRGAAAVANVESEFVCGHVAREMMRSRAAGKSTSSP